MDKVPAYSVLTIDGSEVHFIDHDVLEIISEFKNKAHDRHIQLQMINIETVETAAISLKKPPKMKALLSKNQILKI